MGFPGRNACYRALLWLYFDEDDMDEPSESYDRGTALSWPAGQGKHPAYVNV